MDKLEPVSWSTWLAILRRLPSAQLLLLEPSSPTALAVATHLRAEAAAQGVSPSRLVFLPRVPKQAHIARLAQTCHLFLDTFAYGAHSTASDSLFVGVPLLTIPGWGGIGDPLGKFPGRVGASLLHAMGRDETVAFSPRDFEDLAVQIAQSISSPVYTSLTSLLASSVMASPTFSVPSITHHLERGKEPNAKETSLAYNQPSPTLHGSLCIQTS